MINFYYRSAIDLEKLLLSRTWPFGLGSTILGYADFFTRTRGLELLGLEIINNKMGVGLGLGKKLVSSGLTPGTVVDTNSHLLYCKLGQVANLFDPGRQT